MSDQLFRLRVCVLCDEADRRMAMRRLTRDKACGIAINIVQLSDLLRKYVARLRRRCRLVVAASQAGEKVNSWHSRLLDTGLDCQSTAALPRRSRS